MKKNVASQTVGAQMVSASDGSAFTGAVTVHVTGDGGTQAAGSVGSGACTHEGNGYHSYSPAQAETNYDHVAFTFVGTGAVPATVQIYTSFPQTGDNFARLGAPAGGSVSADIAALQTSVNDLPTNAELATALGTADDAVLAQIALVKASTDNLPSDPADASVIAGLIAAVDAKIDILDTNVDQIETIANKLDTTLELADTDGNYQFTAQALENAPAGGGGGTDWTAGEREQIRHRLGIDGTADAPSATPSLSSAAAVEEVNVRGERTVVRGTVGGGSSTTSIVTSAFAPAGAKADQFKGRIVVFDNDTATAELRGQATDITASSNSATPTLTVTALTDAPASGDTFSVL